MYNIKVISADHNSMYQSKTTTTTTTRKIVEMVVFLISLHHPDEGELRGEKVAFVARFHNGLSKEPPSSSVSDTMIGIYIRNIIILKAENWGTKVTIFVV